MIIQNLLKNATEVIHAGDPDREGQLLIDEILVEMGWQGLTKRIWLQDLTTDGIKQAFKNIKENSDYRGLYDAAVSRSRCDWLLGMNVTRAFTLAYQKAGGDGVISVGRVQTPTLNLIVERDRVVENFRPLPYYTIKAQFKQKESTISANWQPSEYDSDPDGRCLKREIAESVCNKVAQQHGSVESYSRKKRREKPPLPFSLSQLQTTASSKWGYGAQEVLDAAQRLYEEHKLTTYPRTDCGYLSEGQHSDAKNIIGAIAKVNPILVKDVDLKRKSKAFNDKKVTAHTGIIPTAKTPDITRLSKIETALYGIIARHYVAQFLPDHEFYSVEIKISCMDEMFIAKGREVIVEGWKSVLPTKNNKTEGVDLPKASKGESVPCLSTEILDKQTKPLSRFTEGTLIKAMAGIARYVDDQRVKDALKESAGIGTEATRASIIETLKQRNYIQAKGKKVISTEHGRHFIDSIPGRVKDPAVTAWWEQQMNEITEGADAELFLEKMTGWMSKLVSHTTPEQFKVAARANPKKIQDNGNPPTKKMMELAKSIAKERNIKLPKGYTKSFSVTHKFIDEQLNKSVTSPASH
jgi:DNA topoisomerase-3